MTLMSSSSSPPTTAHVRALTHQIEACSEGGRHAQALSLCSELQSVLQALATAAAARAAMFARISASRAPGTAIAAFCSGAASHTVLSPPAVQHALLACFTTRAVLPLRAACREARAAVAGCAWEDRALRRGARAFRARAAPMCAGMSGRHPLAARVSWIQTLCTLRGCGS
jgi:hypothetical protein